MTGFEIRADVPHFVYELIDAKGEHLYVGCTSNLPNRLGNHAGSRDWAEEIVRVEASRYPDMRSALDAEKELIQLYQPRHNVVHTDRFDKGGWANRRARMAEAHDAGRLCSDRVCKQCPPNAHAQGRQCADYAYCAVCPGFMPTFEPEYQDVAAQESAWLKLAEMHGGEYANGLLEYSNADAEVALAVAEDHLTLGDLRNAHHGRAESMVRERLIALQAEGKAVPRIPEPLRPLSHRGRAS